MQISARDNSSDSRTFIVHATRTSKAPIGSRQACSQTVGPFGYGRWEQFLFWSHVAGVKPAVSVG
jgi:hypothetical protein